MLGESRLLQDFSDFVGVRTIPMPIAPLTEAFPVIGAPP